MQHVVSLAVLLIQDISPPTITDEPWTWVDPEHSFTCSNIEISEDTRPPQALLLLEPAYPHTSSPIVGQCTLSFDVTSEGLPENIVAADCLEPRTVRGSVRTVERLRFSPAMQDGVPIRCEQAEITYLWGPGVDRLNEVRSINLDGAPVLSVGGSPCEFEHRRYIVSPPRFLSHPPPSTSAMDLSHDEIRCRVSFDIGIDGAPLNISEPDCSTPTARRPVSRAMQQAVFIPAILGPRPIAWCGAEMELAFIFGD